MTRYLVFLNTTFDRQTTHQTLHSS